MPLLYTITIIIGIQFAVLHAIAEYFELYWRYDWLDVPMHLMGGILVTLMLYTVASICKYRTKLVSLTSVVLWALVPLFAWEVFGVYRYGGFKPGFWIDSPLDIVFGILGVVIGYYLSRSLMRL